MRLRRKIQKPNKGNGGFTLIEVMVTLMVIAIISIPLIHSFVTSARVNYKARRLQNATDVAQNVAEIFQTQSMEYLMSAEYGLTQDQTTGNYTASFEQTGAEGENFTVDVTMERTGSFYEVPTLHNFFGDSQVVCIREITRYDERALEELGLDEKTAAVSKSAVFTVETNSDGSYAYSVQIFYTYGSDTYATASMPLASGSIADGEDTADAFPVLYILYTPYQVDSGTYAVLDQVSICYETDSVLDTKPTEVYFIPQTDESETAVGSYTYQNLTVAYGGITKSASDYQSADTNEKFLYYYYDSTNSTLTQSNKIVYVYSVEISVSYGSDVVTGLSTLRQDTEWK